MRVALLLLITLQGCLTFSGDKLADMDPPAAIGTHSFETAFRDFNFQLDGGAMTSSATIADKINRWVMRCWQDHGYVSTFVQLGREPSTGGADYTLTLTGNVDGESSVVLQVISGLTLLIIPNTMDARAFLTFELKRARDGATFKASVAENVNQVNWLPFILFLPWMNTGIGHAMDKIAFHLYQQFAAQGAFEAAAK